MTKTLEKHDALHKKEDIDTRYHIIVSISAMHEMRFSDFNGFHFGFEKSIDPKRYFVRLIANL